MVTIKDYLDFAWYMFRPRTLKWCLRMSDFERMCYSFDYAKLEMAAVRERYAKLRSERP